LRTVTLNLTNVYATYAGPKQSFLQSFMSTLTPSVDVSHKYFPHIDGLRAVAVLPVVAFHLARWLCPGGFTGVDIFFVISGYLITKGIVAELDAKRFSILDFYVRRVKRILPAYFAIIAFVLIAFPLVSSFLEYRSICDAAFYSVIYSANWYFWSGISYFDLNAVRNPLLHLWSLGVEEQFYLIVPALICLLSRFNRHALLKNLAIICMASFAFSVWLVVSDQRDFAFYMLPSRAWELMAGSVVSLINKENLWSKSVFAFLGIVFIAISYIFVNENLPFPGPTALPSVIGAALLILFGDTGKIGRFLSSKALVGIGKVSYSLYLWHWPIFVFIDVSIGPRRAAIAVLLTLITTYLSYRFIELPVRRDRKFNARKAFSMFAVGSLLLLAFTGMIGQIESKNGSVPQQWRGVATWVKAEELRLPSRSHAELSSLQAGKFLLRIGDDKKTPTFALWGDSHALALLPAVDLLATERKEAGYYINLKQSLTLNAYIGAFPFNPHADREPVLLWLEEHREVHTVFLVNHWRAHILNDTDIEELVSICKRLETGGKRVVVMTNPPVILRNDETLRRLSWGMKVDEKNSFVPFTQYEEELKWQAKAIQSLKRETRVVIVDGAEPFSEKSGHRIAKDSKLFFIDTNHLNAVGAEIVMRHISPMIWPE